MAEVLAEEFPTYDVPLDHGSAFQLLAAVILSAQCTDAMVNRVTPELFARYPDAAAMASADPAEVESIIHRTGFFRAKTQSLIGMAQAVQERFGGEVPQAMDALVSLPGVGRKTANVVLNVAYGEPTMAVDTHIFRVSNRTGLAPGKTPLAVELKLLQRVPPKYMNHAHHWLILHGRYVCMARTPRCWECAVAACCDYADKTRAPDR